MLLESMFSLLYGITSITSVIHIHIFCTELPKNTSEEEKETTYTSICNLTQTSDIKHQLNHKLGLMGYDKVSLKILLGNRQMQSRIKEEVLNYLKKTGNMERIYIYIFCSSSN